MIETACIVACSPPTASVFFWRHRLGSYHSQLLLVGRKPLNAAQSDGDAAIEVFKRSSTCSLTDEQYVHVIYGWYNS